jgi:glycerate 2-kinase
MAVPAAFCGHGHGSPAREKCEARPVKIPQCGISQPTRNSVEPEFLLSLGIALGGHPRIHALAGDTDGVDGQDEIAGAVLSPDSLARAWSLGRPPRDSLDTNDGHGFFEALGSSVITGPTLTNVNDFRAILIEADGHGPARNAQ